MSPLPLRHYADDISVDITPLIFSRRIIAADAIFRFSLITPLAFHYAIAS